MNNIKLTRCTIQEMGKVYLKFCLSYEGQYYDINTLNHYDIFDGKNGVIKAEILDENLVPNQEGLYKRKLDLLGRLEEKKFYDISNPKVFFETHKNTSFVIYKLKEIALNDKAEVCFKEYKKEHMGVMYKDDIYDMKTGEKIKTINDDLTFGDICLSTATIIPKEAFTEDEYLTLLFIFLGVVNKENIPKIIVLN